MRTAQPGIWGEMTSLGCIIATSLALVGSVAGTGDAPSDIAPAGADDACYEAYAEWAQDDIGSVETGSYDLVHDLFLDECVSCCAGAHVRTGERPHHSPDRAHNFINFMVSTVFR